MDARALHDEHVELLAQVRTMHAAMEEPHMDADRMAWRVRKLGMGLKRHFETERTCLYGRLLEEPDPTTRALAAACRDEAAAAEEALRDFLRHWIVPLHIARDPEGFRCAAQDLFYRIGRRTGVEERELLPRLRNLNAA